VPRLRGARARVRLRGVHEEGPARVFVSAGVARHSGPASGKRCRLGGLGFGRWGGTEWMPSPARVGPRRRMRAWWYTLLSAQTTQGRPTRRATRRARVTLLLDAPGCALGVRPRAPSRLPVGCRASAVRVRGRSAVGRKVGNRVGLARPRLAQSARQPRSSIGKHWIDRVLALSGDECVDSRDYLLTKRC
jgi:hypothetical protein